MTRKSSRGITRRAALSTLAALPVIAGALPRTFARAQTADPLPSWNDGASKEAILAFVQATTDQSGPHFVQPEARIATFDQDGTLWVEHPIYTQVVYCLDRVPAVVSRRPLLTRGLPRAALIPPLNRSVAQRFRFALFRGHVPCVGYGFGSDMAGAHVLSIEGARRDGGVRPLPA